MKEILELFWSFLMSHGYPQPAYIDKGFHRDTVIATLKKCMKEPPGELVDFYEFQNGSPWANAHFNETFIIDYGYIIPVQDIEKYTGLLRNDVFGKSLYEELIPILLSGGGEMYLYSTNPSSKYKIYVLKDGLSTPEPVPAFRSLEQLVRTAFEGFKRGVYRFENGWLRFNREEQLKLFVDMNPDISFWKHGYRQIPAF